MFFHSLNYMQAAPDGWYVHGISIQGATWNSESAAIEPPHLLGEDLTPLPVLLIRVAPAPKASEQQLFTSHQFRTQPAGIDNLDIYETLERTRAIGTIDLSDRKEIASMRSVSSAPHAPWMLRAAAFCVHSESDPKVQ